jgi:proline iminopeptidase
VRNDAARLLGDIRALLAHLKMSKIHLAGGSWGSTLALAFALEHPQMISSLLLYGVFLCRRKELEALYFPGGLAARLHPERFASFMELLPKDDRADPIAGYGRLFASPHRETRRRALDQWTRLEKSLSRLHVEEEELARELADPDFVLSHSLIENHYFRHGCFIDGEKMLQAARTRLNGLHVHIINGRLDLICPPQTAFELHRAIRGSKLEIVPMAGHSFREETIARAIIRAAAGLPQLSRA